MEQVTIANLDAFLKRYAKARGGEQNEATDCEAMFVFCAKYRGMYILTTAPALIWIGLQNTTARWTNNGGSFPSVKVAITRVLTAGEIGAGVFYSEDAVARLTWCAQRLAEFKASGDFLLEAEL